MYVQRRSGIHKLNSVYLSVHKTECLVQLHKISVNQENLRDKTMDKLGFVPAWVASI